MLLQFRGLQSNGKKAVPFSALLSVLSGGI